MEWFVMNGDGRFFAMATEDTSTVAHHFGAVGFDRYEEALHFAATLTVAHKFPSLLVMPFQVCHRENGKTVVDVLIDRPH